MEWSKYTIKTTDEAVEAISSMLMSLGIGAVEIDDAYMPSDEDLAEMFLDIAPETLPDFKDKPDEGVSHVSFYLRIPSDDDFLESERVEEFSKMSESVDASYAICDKAWDNEERMLLLERIKEGILDISKFLDVGEASISEELSKEEDWRDNWKKYYKPIKAGDILIKPTWEDVPKEYEEFTKSGELKVVDMEPGTAFGTGSHETTRLCIEAVSEYIKDGDKVLDIGTGSGILGISALKKGAKLCVATEIDPACSHIVYENCNINGIGEEKFKLFIGNIIEDDLLKQEAFDFSGGKFDVVISNILAPVIVTLAKAGQVDNLIREGGYYFASGIIKDREQEVLSAFSKNPSWEDVRTKYLGDWVLVIARRK